MATRTRDGRCTCYVENCTPANDPLRRRVTAVVDCEKHSTPELRELKRRGEEAARADR